MTRPEPAPESAGIQPRGLDTCDLLNQLADEPATIIIQDAGRLQAAQSCMREGPGTLIGRYRLIEPLGEGGFGMVWRAEQSEPIRREVALKVIKPGMDSREIIARFEAERQALAMMDHPNIAGVLDAGTTDSGRPFFVMELVKGTSITEYCDARRLTIRQRLELFIPVCQAVQHAHQKAILHRDLKPSNILVIEVDGRPVPMVIDFGIAKALDTTGESMLQAGSMRTQAGMVIGTPQYMSPEQAGSRPDVDTRSDVYTLGVILYELLVGETPLSHELMRQAALDEMLRLIREEEPLRPSLRFTPCTELARTAATRRHTEPRKLGLALRGDLDWIVMKALEKDRVRRYETATALARDLQHHLRQEPVSAAAPTWRYQLAKFTRRNRLALGTAGGVAIILVVATIVSLWQAALARRSSAEAEAQRMQVTQERDKQNELLWDASRADHETAITSFQDNRRWDGLAHLERALKLQPGNTDALIASASFAFGSAAPSWRVHSVIVPEKPGWRTAFSPDGNLCAVADLDKDIRVWETATNREIGSVKPEGSVYTLSFSPDGRWLASMGMSACIINSRTGQKIAQLKIIGQHLSFSPDSRLVAIGGTDKTARVVAVETGRELYQTTFEESVRGLLFSPDGKMLAAHDGHTFKMLEAASGREIFKASYARQAIGLLAFSPDSRSVAMSLMQAGVQNSGSLIVMAADTGAPGMEREIGPTIHQLRFGPDGGWLAVGDNQGTARVLEVASGQELHQTTFLKSVDCLDFSPDGRWLAVKSAEAKLAVIDASSGRLMDQLMVNGPIIDVRFSLDGMWLNVDCVGGARWVFEAASIKAFNRVAFGRLISSLSFSQDGESLAVGTYYDPSGVQVVAPDSGRETARFDVGTQATSVSFSPDGRWLGVGDLDGTLHVLDSVSGKVARTHKFEKSVNSNCFSSDGRLLAAGSDDKTARVIEMASGKEITRYQSSGNGVDSVSFSPDGRWLAIGDGWSNSPVIEALTGKIISRDQSKSVAGKVSFNSNGLWVVRAGDYHRDAGISEAATGKVVFQKRFPDAVDSAVLSPNDRWLAVACRNETSQQSKVILVDSAKGKEVCRVLMRDHVSTLMFSPDGRRLALGSWGSPAEVSLFDCSWFDAGEESCSNAWRAGLWLQMTQVLQEGRMTPLKNSELQKVNTLLQAAMRQEPKKNERWQHAILRWSRELPHQRTTSPWSQEPVWRAVGRWLMQFPTKGKDMMADHPCLSIIDHAHSAPWHPLTPVSLARLKLAELGERASLQLLAASKDKEAVAATVEAVQEVVRVQQAFLCRLTLRRLREADEKMYGRETLAEYAFWAYNIMTKELGCEAEGREALNFALDRSPDNMKPLLQEKAQSVLHGPMVRRIHVTFHGPKVMTEAEVRAMLPGVEGRRCSDENVEQFVRAIYSTGLVDTVEVNMNDDAGAATLEIKINTKEKAK